MPQQAGAIASSLEGADARTHSSRVSHEAAGWLGERGEVESVTDLYRAGYVPKSFHWVDPRLLWRSRNDKVARWFEDPTDDDRRRWVTAQLMRGVSPDFVVDRFAERPSLSFVVLGDPGEGDASQYHLLRPLAARGHGIDFSFVCSDVIYPTGDVHEYLDKFFWPYRDLEGPIYAIPGNHDWYDGLHGFMTHFCAADPSLRPAPASPTSRWRRQARRALWRREATPDPVRLEEMRALRPDAAVLPGPYFAVEAGPVLLVGIDTGIQAGLDADQGAWLRRVSRVAKPKILLSGKPLYVDAAIQILPIGPRGAQGTVNEIVDDPAHAYLAVIAGDIHNYQRYPIRLRDGRTIQHIVSGAGGAYTKATHKIPRVELDGCSEDEFRCYPRRGDSLAAYSMLYDRRFAFGRGYLEVPYDQAAKIMSLKLQGVEPVRASDHDATITRQASRAAAKVFPLPGRAPGPFHSNFSEILDWNDPPPPLFKSFLRVDVSEREITIRCFAATGLLEHAHNPPLEDWITGRQDDTGRWEWTVELA